MTINKTLDNLERLAKGATPGEWEAWSSIYEGMKAAIVAPAGQLITIAEVRTNYDDAKFLVAANPATILLLTTAIREMEARLKAVEPLVEACVADFTNAATEAHPDAMGYPDADLVAFGVDTKLTFGMIRSARLALSTNGGKG